MDDVTSWRERFIEDMRLHDYRQSTQEAYLLAVRLFMEWVKVPPAKVTDEQVRAYFLYLREVKKNSPSTTPPATSCSPASITSSTRQATPAS